MDKDGATGLLISGSHHPRHHVKESLGEFVSIKKRPPYKVVHFSIELGVRIRTLPIEIDHRVPSSFWGSGDGFFGSYKNTRAHFAKIEFLPLVLPLRIHPPLLVRASPCYPTRSPLAFSFGADDRIGEGEILHLIHDPTFGELPESIPMEFDWSEFDFQDATTRDGVTYRRTNDGEIIVMVDASERYVGRPIPKGSARYQATKAKLEEEVGPFFVISVDETVGAEDEYDEYGFVILSTTAALLAAGAAAGGGAGIASAISQKTDSTGGIASRIRKKSSSTLRKIAKSKWRRRKVRAAARKELRRRKRKKAYKKKIAAEARQERAAIKALEALQQEQEGEGMEEGQEEVLGYLPVNPVLDQIGAQLVFGGVVAYTPPGQPGGSANHDDGTMDRHMGLDYDWYEEMY
jgi:hypothetical protein